MDFSDSEEEQVPPEKEPESDSDSEQLAQYDEFYKTGLLHDPENKMREALAEAVGVSGAAPPPSGTLCSASNSIAEATGVGGAAKPASGALGSAPSALFRGVLPAVEAHAREVDGLEYTSLLHLHVKRKKCDLPLAASTRQNFCDFRIRNQKIY